MKEVHYSGVSSMWSSTAMNKLRVQTTNYTCNFYVFINLSKCLQHSTIKEINMMADMQLGNL